jgi:hypothetical protein
MSAYPYTLLRPSAQGEWCVGRAIRQWSRRVAYINLIGKPERKYQIGKPRYRW